MTILICKCAICIDAAELSNAMPSEDRMCFNALPLETRLATFAHLSHAARPVVDPMHELMQWLEA